jgi:nitronate monooxygenase
MVLRNPLPDQPSGTTAVKNLSDLLGLELPVIQAPMAGVQGSALAGAVSHAGGLGSLPCAMLTLDEIRSEVAAIRQDDQPALQHQFLLPQDAPGRCRARAPLA